MKVLDIIPGTSVDGPGLRTSIYLAGCDHHCPGCHNPQSWDFNGGTDLSVDRIMEEVEANGFNVTLTGGDPIYHAKELLPLAIVLRERGYDIWLYTGFLMEQLLEMPDARALLPWIDVVVDGPFIEAQRDVHLIFRGSANQRLIAVAPTLESGRITLFEPYV